jgi:hypothetical protein
VSDKGQAAVYVNKNAFDGSLEKTVATLQAILASKRTT